MSKRSLGKKVQLDQFHTIGTDRYCEWSKPNRLCNFCERLSTFTPKSDPLKGPLGVDHQRIDTDIAADLG